MVSLTFGIETGRQMNKQNKRENRTIDTENK